MDEREQLDLENAAGDVLRPWMRKIAPFHMVELQLYLYERDRHGKTIAERVALSCGAKVELTRLDSTLARLREAAEWKWNPPDHLAAGW
jgi:hypothetical protein